MPSAPPDSSPPPSTPGEPRVALVHDWLTGMRGGEKVLEAIAARFPGAPIYTLFHFPGSVSAALEAHPIVSSFLQRAPGIRRWYRHYLPLFPAAIEDFDLSGYDLIVSTSHCVAKGVVPGPGARHLCYCHTPMRYAWDQEHAYFPRRRGLAARLRNLALTALRSWDVASAPRVDRFVANSRFVARRIERYYGREAAVLAPPVDVAAFTPAAADTAATTDGAEAAAGSPYALAIAALAPYKRLDVAIEAAARLDLELRLVGTGPERPALERQARRRGARVDFLGRVDHDRLVELLRGALALVQPGIEDFGIAPVEALACATPVVARGRGGVLDIVEDGVHGVLYDGGADADLETEAAALAAALERVRSTAGDGGAQGGAIDKSRRLGFNRLELRRRAEDFSAPRFLAGLEALLEPLISSGPADDRRRPRDPSAVDGPGASASPTASPLGGPEGGSPP